jgi:hypothetical protein
MLNNIAAILDAGVAASTNSYESISTVTVGSGGQATITFSSIPSTYKHLQIRGIMVQTVGSSSTNIQFNSDTTTTNYYYHRLQGTGANPANAAAGNLFRIFDGTSTSPNFQGFVLDVLDYANTNKYTTSRALAGFDANGSGQINLTSNLWKNTAAINAITFTTDSSTFGQYSSFALYGIKG